MKLNKLKSDIFLKFAIQPLIVEVEELNTDGL